MTTKKTAEQKTADQKHVDSLRATITKMTGRTPVSRDPRYLEQRLASLEKRKAAGEDIRRKPPGTSVISASMPVEAGKAFDRIVEREKVGASDIVRRALAYWAAGNGYAAEARALGADA
jgi:cell division septum initiation protein DivIVA